MELRKLNILAYNAYLPVLENKLNTLLCSTNYKIAEDLTITNQNGTFDRMHIEILNNVYCLISNL